MTVQQKASEVFKSWGVSDSQITRFLENETSQSQSEHVVAIDECLELLYREPKQRHHFLTTASKSVFFEGRKPLDVILSGEVEQVAEAHHIIRSMLCI